MYCNQKLHPPAAQSERNHLSKLVKERTNKNSLYREYLPESIGAAEWKKKKERKKVKTPIPLYAMHPTPVLPSARNGKIRHVLSLLGQDPIIECPTKLNIIFQHLDVDGSARVEDNCRLD